MGQTLRLNEHHDLLVTATFAEHMPSNGPESSAKQIRHDVNGKNTKVVTEKAGRSLQGPSGFSVINSRSTSQRD